MTAHRRAWGLRRGEIVDGGFLGVLLVLGLLGFGTTYGDSRYLVAGVTGVLLGLVVGCFGVRLRAPAVPVAVVSFLVFFLFGGAIALRGTVSAGVLPNRANLQALADGAVRGWYGLLTVLPPVGATGNLLAIPYLLGLSGSVLGYTLARRSRYAFVPVLSPVAVLASSILFGSNKPAALVLQGAVFAGVSLAWIALRTRAGEPAVVRSPRGRKVSAAALIVGAAAGAVLVGPVLPLAGANERVVLRDHVEPPLDLRDYVSPLSTYRKYVVPAGKARGGGGLGDQTLFTVEGLPTGALIRIATMDAYDGTVWNVAGGTAPATGDGVGGSGSFQQVGERIPTQASGRRATVTFTLGALGGIWLPSVGVVTRVRFWGTNADYLAKTFRYNRATDSAVAATLPAAEPLTLQPGDRYTIDVVVPPATLTPPEVDPVALTAAGPAGFGLPEPARVPEAVKAKVTEVVGSTQGVFARVQSLADELGRGAYSDGTAGEIPSLAGHYAARLDRMVSDPQGLVGDAEQYAAVMALMTRQLGIPARVVMGVRPQPNAGSPRLVKGTDVTAWVEVGLRGLGWVPVFPTPPSTAKKPQTIPRPKPITRVQEPPKAVAPPRVVAAPLISAGEPAARKANDKKSEQRDKPVDPDAPSAGRRLGLVVAVGVSIPVIVLGAVVLTLALKRRRSRRRRRRGSPSTRIAGGWAEVVDLARDTGAAVPLGGTRRDVAVSLDRADLIVLARRADQAVFAPGEPSERDVTDYWADVATARSDLARRLGRWARLKVALNPTSLRWSRPSDVRARP